MKLRKLLAVTAVAATMTAAFAVNAMAETTNNLVSGTDFTYDAKTGIITLTTDKQPSAAPYPCWSQSGPHSVRWTPDSCRTAGRT